MNKEHLNYCRHLRKQITAQLAIPSLNQTQRVVANHVLDLCAASQKFILPDGGFLLFDAEFRALSADVPLHLPHSFVALEFYLDAGRTKHERLILFVREHRDEPVLVLTIVYFDRTDGTWKTFPSCRIPVTGYFGQGQTDATGKDGLRFFYLLKDDQVAGIEALTNQAVSCVLSFLNALECSNVRIERSEPRKAGKKIKTAIPFDTYHVLTIDVGRSGECSVGAGGIGHRSPREHLRRGHIVRPEGRRPYWRNATVVCAGRGFAKVEKDYRLRNAPAPSNAGDKL